jgi:uncharacterized membrane protein YheB (UPF0754 family)
LHISRAMCYIVRFMSYLSFIIYPVIGAFVGAFTNAVAIKLLFWPRRPFLGIQGLLPKRRSEIAQRAGELVNGYLVNSEAIRRRIDRRRLDESIDRFLSKSGSRLWDVPLMKRGVKKAILSVLLDKDGFFNKNVIESFIDEGMVSGIVEQKIAELDLHELESLTRKASGPELRFIVLSGGILGFLVGVAEVFITFIKV